MEQNIRLQHPRGKKPVSMQKEKYELLKSSLLKVVRNEGRVTFSGLADAIEKEFKSRKIRFQGSLPWHLEWVKLDLEARKKIRRVAGTSPQEYEVNK